MSKQHLLNSNFSEALFDPRNTQEEAKRGYVDINNREYVRVQNEVYDEPGTRVIQRGGGPIGGDFERRVVRTEQGAPEVVRVSTKLSQ